METTDSVLGTPLTKTCHRAPHLHPLCFRGTIFSTMRVRVANSAANCKISVELRERPPRVRRHGQSTLANARLRRRRGRKAVVNRRSSGALFSIAHVACNVVYQIRFVRKIARKRALVSGGKHAVLVCKVGRHSV